MKSNKIKYNLTNDPMSISLTKPTKMININDLVPQEVERDDIFTKKYIQFMNGKKMFILQDYHYPKLKKVFTKEINMLKNGDI